MNESIYELYVRTRMLIKEAEEHGDFSDKEYSDLVQGWRDSNEVIETTYPQAKIRYERIAAMHQSFTYEQIDFICATIGDWYWKWKHQMATGEGTQHRLGYAKEELKHMLCGDGNGG